MKTPETSVGLLLVVLGLLMLNTQTRAQSSGPGSLADGLVAYYPFNGNANDESGNHRNGLVVGATLAPDRFGNTAGAYAFNAEGNYIVVTNSLHPQGEVTLTYSLWISYHPTTNFYDVVINVATPETGASASNFVSNSRSSLMLSDNPPVIRYIGENNDIYLGPIVPENSWHHWVLTKAGTKLAVFLDGLLERTGSTQPGQNVTSKKLFIGSNGNPLHYAGEQFHGSISDVRIYNRALSTNEVAQLYAFESLPPAPTPCSPYAATATAAVVNGFVVGIDVQDAGCGYTNAPLVEIVDGTGTGATATATMQNGVVTGITVKNAGSGYTTNTVVLIASPPFVPWLDIAVSKVKVTQHVVLGQTYVLESSNDIQTWTPLGPPFTAESETLTQEFDVDVVGRYFRIRQVP